MSTKMLEPCVFVVFGALGDLSRRKLLPALARATAAELWNDRVHIVGVDRDTDMDDKAFHGVANDSLKAAGAAADDISSLVNERLHYFCIGDNSDTAYEALQAFLLTLESDNELPGNRAFYLALPPRVFTSAIEHMGHVGLNQSPGWTRIVVEKPFGKDLESAKALNAAIHEHFTEPQIYRIDHYLGKETVQNLLVFRLANAMIESVWNRDRVEAVQITVAESLGVGSRADYYDQSGALRDMVQNHIMQLLTLVAMEVPVAFDADAIRHEKIKVLKSIKPVSREKAVYGQYTTGIIDFESVPGYLEAEGVPADSQTESFVALELAINTWRWQGVPFYVRTGKRLPKRVSQIALRFRETPIKLFETMGLSEGDTMETADVLLITLQPDEGFSFHFDVKKPGGPFNTQRIPLVFRYNSIFEKLPDAYQTLLLDVIAGDQTLFVHGDEVEHSWELFADLISDPPGPHPYEAGTWGPKEADHLCIPERELWNEEF